jgi:hypothetical protein
MTAIKVVGPFTDTVQPDGDDEIGDADADDADDDNGTEFEAEPAPAGRIPVTACTSTDSEDTTRAAVAADHTRPVCQVFNDLP